MSEDTVAGVDWASGKWLAVVMGGDQGMECHVEDQVDNLCDSIAEFERILIDVPIGLPDDEVTLAKREELDSCVRSMTGRSSSVFPVPSRAACEAAKDEDDYDEVAQKNRDEIEKGLTWQSYYIAKGIGEVDAFLQANPSATEILIESHPELCFAGLRDQQLVHAKTTAQGIGERLDALEGHLDEPSRVVSQLCQELIGEEADISIDDVVDALGLCVVARAAEDELQFLPEADYYDSNRNPMQMAYCSETPRAEF